MADNTSTKLNLFKLKTLIDSGIASIPVDKKHHNAVLVIGDTGVGKTTILSFLAKRKLFIKIHGLNTILDSDDQDGLKIGHDKFSQTRVPSKIIIDKLVFFDCSGFKDNRGEEFEISNSFFVQRLFDIYNNIKILLIVDQSSVSEARADKLPKLIRNLLKSFSKLSDIQDGVILLINRAKPDFSEKVYSQQLLKIAGLKTEDGYLFNQEQRRFLQFLVNNKKVCLFKQAQREDDGKPLDVKQQNLLNLIKDTNYVKSKKIRNIISESAKLSIRDFIDHLADQGQPKIQRLCQQVIKDFSYKSHSNFSDSIAAAKDIKGKVIQFSQNIENSKDSDLVETIRGQINFDMKEFELDVSAVLFFKQIYNKAEYYFKLIRSNLAATLSKMIMQIDSDIAVLQQHLQKMRSLEDQVKESKKKQQELRKELQEVKKYQQQQKKQIEILNNRTNEEIKNRERVISQRNEQISTIEKQLQTLLSDYASIQQFNKNCEQAQKNLRDSIQRKNSQISELAKLVESLTLQNKQQTEQISFYLEENIGLKNQLMVALSEAERSKVSELDISISSKTSKYPDVVCPHFKNGGKCVHCIKKWKAEQKKQKVQQ